MRLRKGDEVIAMDIARDDSDLFVITENGFGKRTRISEYRIRAAAAWACARSRSPTARAIWSACKRGAREPRDHAAEPRRRDDPHARRRDQPLRARDAGRQVMNMREGDVVSAMARMVVSADADAAAPEAGDEEIEG